MKMNLHFPEWTYFMADSGSSRAGISGNEVKLQQEEEQKRSHSPRWNPKHILSIKAYLMVPLALKNSKPQNDKNPVVIAVSLKTMTIRSRLFPFLKTLHCTMWRGENESPLDSGMSRSRFPTVQCAFQ